MKKNTEDFDFKVEDYKYSQIYLDIIGVATISFLNLKKFNLF